MFSVNYYAWGFVNKQFMPCLTLIMLGYLSYISESKLLQKYCSEEFLSYIIPDFGSLFLHALELYVYRKFIYILPHHRF